METMGKKLELESLHSRGLNFMAETYLVREIVVHLGFWTHGITTPSCTSPC
jgi:hypothetical protein